MKSLQCDHCGGVMPFHEELGGRCARCLLELAVVVNTQELEDDSQNLPGHLDAGTYVGRYCILRSIGDGGMGIVYEAEQEQPRRNVALKLIRPGMAGKATLRRFERETQALGRLQHHGIAQIYDAGTADTGFGPQPYFAMELIRGLTPGEYVKQHRLSVRERLELVAKVAEAVHHAHQRGIIHRDLKPSNILVDETGQPKILDFGVSRAVDDSAPRTRQTEMGQLLGTVAYMSPEQVMGDPLEIDIRTDIYALGVILYELLADRPPYDVEGNLHEALTAVREAEPTPLGTLVRDYKGDIETIAAKALEKDKNRRYTSAAELAADIRRFLSEEPIIARPPTAAYQLKKFARRNKVLVTAAALVIVALLFGVVISTWQARRAWLAEQAALADRDRALQAEAMATEERDRARQAELTAAEQRNLALDARQGALAAGLTANTERDRANVERDRALNMQQRADEERSRAQTAEDQARHEATVANTQRRIAVSQYLVREALRPETVVEDYDLASLLVVQALRFNTRIPAQPWLSIEDALQQAVLWNPLRHTLPTGGFTAYHAVAFSPDGTQLAAGGEDQIVRVWNIRTRGMAPLLLDARGRETGGIRALEFSRDGRLLAVGSLGANLDATSADTIRIWNLQSAASAPLLLAGGGNIESLAFSPDSQHLVSSAQPQIRGVAGIVLWNLRAQKSPMTLVQDTQMVNALSFGRVAFSPDGARVAAATESAVKVWDLRNPSRVLFSVQPPPLPINVPGPPQAVHSVAFAPDGVHLTVSSRSGIHIWDLRNLQAPPVALTMTGRPANSFRLLKYTSDGSRLAATDGSAWIWDLRNLAARPTMYAPQPNDGVSGIAYSIDGQRLAAATPTGVKLWDFSSGGQPPVSPPVRRETPNRRMLPREFVYSDDLTRIFDATGDVPQLWELGQSPARSIALDDKSSTSTLGSIALGSRTGVFCRRDTRLVQFAPSNSGVRVTVWDIGAGVSAPLLLRSREFRAGNPFLACSADGSRLAFPVLSFQELSIQVVDLERPDMPTLFIFQIQQGATALAFSRDGNMVAVGGRYSVDLWKLTDRAVHIRSIPITAGAGNVVLSPDGNRLAADGSVIEGQGGMWDIRNWAATTFPSSSALAFSPDGARFATSNNGFVRVWDLQNPSSQSLNFRSVMGTVIALRFSSDDRRLKAGDTQGRVAEWPLSLGAADVLCTRVWRNLSIKEWQAYVGEGIPYEKTCPALPLGAGAPGGPE